MKNTIKVKGGYKGERNGMYGKHIPHTKEAKQKISASTSGERNGMYGKHHSDESKRKQSEAKRGSHRVYDNPEHTKWHMEK